ncbi:hypothetical protein EHS86_04160 [Erwinia amylovora]|uniref:Uncharacterized protein n=3 Tax=Erwinia amylovora TaxID=552 RepID=A0A831A1J0_ERWAM|nr:hypothetical protein AD997_15005 [Erwinia amylovora]EKV55359.1 hypothetical protein EaACW_0508 [Erwinia amylovora ACW56400]CBA19453.1 hypothetical protein predicted by Glimmer/Critica [Erwinia amylovora CFBP1430]CBJ47599.1 hypothetical protein EAM_2925 [Erwinia amylovora ATCC 49946]CBX79319.1 hypothetical protein predicted by Glimmer/Critica [Erwinia amylovora ATCC BAA-2158]CCO77353.1 hypothetical protein BN432_0521 [Erwinia amylovora Ea356]CCO81137.1 hypothetical protein BN433_0531 [Erwin
MQHFASNPTRVKASANQPAPHPYQQNDEMIAVIHRMTDFLLQGRKFFQAADVSKPSCYVVKLIF